MSTQIKQVIFVGLAVVLIAFMVFMLRPQGTPATSQGAPYQQTGAATEPQVDPSLTQRINTLQQQVQTDPKNEKALTELGALYFQVQQFAQAADVYNRVVDLDPKNVDVHIDLGRAYFYQGMSSTAIKEFRKAVELDPKKVDAHYNLALALSHSAPPDVDAAVASWKEVIKLAPDSDQAKKSQSFIDAYTKQQPQK